MQRLFVPLLILSVCAVAQTCQAQLKPRKLAPGVVTVIKPNADASDTFTQPRELIEIVRGYPQLDWQPNFAPKNETLLEKAKTTVFRRDVWYLEFGFKPLRMINAPVRMADGSVRNQLVWYLVYWVRNNGTHLSPVAKADEFGDATFDVTTKSYPVRFTPNFILRSMDRRKAYLDQVMPAALQKIRQREDPAIRFHDSISITEQPIVVSSENDDNKVWGVATWTGIDPKTDFVSIYVRGLTNAYRWHDEADGFKPGSPPGTGRKLADKTLKLNFWRPGDQYKQNEKEIRYGIPYVRDAEKRAKVLRIYQQPKRRDHVWVYQ